MSGGRPSCGRMAQGNLSLAAGLWEGVGKGWVDHAAASMCMATCRPAAVAILTSVSRLNRLILPRINAEMRGWVTPRAIAAWVWVMPLAVVVEPCVV